MSTWELRTATDDDIDEMFAFDGRMFGEPWEGDVVEPAKAMMELDRFRVVRDDGRLVGVAGSYAQQLTVPGNAQLANGGVTWVAVAPTHRRQGMLRQLMDALHDDIDARGEPLAALTASEGGIYERFGYGIASSLRCIEIDRRRTQIQERFRPEPGSVRLTDLSDPAIPELWDRYRLQRNGELNRSPERDALRRADLNGKDTVALHRDGYAAWQVNAKWHDGHPAHEMQLFEVAAMTPDAFVALWHTILSVDLVGPIRSARAVSIDDPLAYLIDDQRALRTTNLNDNLWLRIQDIAATLSARTYGTDDRLVVEVDLGDHTERWRIDGSPDGAEVRKVRTRPDLIMDRATLGALYLGGVRPSALAAGRRLEARNADRLRRADAFFAADEDPHCQTGF